MRKALLATLAVAVMGFATGCGVQADSDAASSGATGADAMVADASGTSGQDNGANATVAKPTRREAGTIRIQGKAQGSLTDQFAKGYESNGGSANVTINDTSENSAFRAFCSGEVDIVDSARPISPNEFRRCQARGVQPVQIQIASDAAILAIKNETDVGVDCLAFDEVQDIYKAGSDINSWSQVGYNRDLVDVRPIRMKIVGPDEKSNVFGFLGQYILGDPEPGALSVRSDYQTEKTDRGVRLATVGRHRDYVLARQYEQYRKALADLRSAISDGKQRLADAKAEIAKGIQDERPPAARAHDRRQLKLARQNLASLRASVPAAERSVRVTEAARKRTDRTLGTMGLFRFSYYELFEEQLRPMEVSATDDADHPECVFPSQATITNATYPLARQLLLTVNYKNLRDSDINDFLSYALSRSQSLAEKSALVPLPDQTRNEEQGWLDGTSEPDVVYYDNAGSGKS